MIPPLAFTALAAALAGGVAVLLAWQVVGFSQLRDALHAPHLGWLAIAALAELVAYAGYVAAYRDAVRVGGGPHLSWGRAVELVTAGFGAHVPGGGFSRDRKALEDDCDDDGDATVRVLGLGALEYALLAPAATGAAAFLIVDGADVPLEVTLPWIVAVPVGFAIALALSGRIDHEAWRTARGRLRRALGSVFAALDLLRGLVARPVRHAGAWVGIAAYWAGDILCLYAALHAFGAHSSVPATIVAFASGYALSRRSLPLAGAAATEVLLVFALNWTGVPFASALIGVVVYRVFNFLLPIVPALVAHRRTAGPARGPRQSLR